MPITTLTGRDVDLLTALARCPLTAVQLVKLSQTFAQPFRIDRLLRRRMARLAQSGLVRRATYTALAGRGAMPNYYLLTPLGYRMLHGPDAPLPAKRFGSPIAPASHRHTWALAEVIVHTVLAAHQVGAEVTGFCCENTVQLTDGHSTIYPDCGFQLATAGRSFSYFVELDNSTERLRTDKEADSWERKIRVYESVRDRTTRFRVLIFSTRSSERVKHILELARSLSTNPRRTLFCGVAAKDFLSTPEALTAPIFHDHMGRSTALLPSKTAAAFAGAVAARGMETQLLAGAIASEARR